MAEEMKVNQSVPERFARIIVGGTLLLLASYIPMNVVLIWVLVIVGILLMFTGLCGWCPLYSLFNINTNR
jgi:hypothetical protein